MAAEHANNSYDVFISYRSTRRAWVETLARNLRRYGYRVFLDSWELVPGRNFAEGLYRGLQHARKAVLVVTPDAVASGWVREEYDAMLSRKQREPSFSFIPLVFGDFSDLPFLSNVQYVDFRDPTLDAYRQAFCHLLCGLEDRAPGPDPRLPDDLEIPEPVQRESASVPVLVSEQAFLEQVFEQIATGRQPLMLLAQAGRGQGEIIQAILERARCRYGEAGTLHVTPPYSPKANRREYFSYLGRQCRFPKPTTSDFQWEDAMDRQLQQSKHLFLLVSGFEHGAEMERKVLAGILRNLSHNPAHKLHIVLCGGQRLAELRYGSTEMSLLNHSQVLCWPELTGKDVMAWQTETYPDSCLSEREAQKILIVCGGHPQLVRYCLQQGRQRPSRVETEWEQTLAEFIPELFIRYRADGSARKRLCEWLEKAELGDFDRWPVDLLLRQLYWDNLLTQRQRRLVWRCDLLRAVGRQVLQCEK